MYEKWAMPLSMHANIVFVSIKGFLWASVFLHINISRTLLLLLLREETGLGLRVIKAHMLWRWIRAWLFDPRHSSRKIPRLSKFYYCETVENHSENMAATAYLFLKKLRLFFFALFCTIFPAKNIHKHCLKFPQLDRPGKTHRGEKSASREIMKKLIWHKTKHSKCQLLLRGAQQIYRRKAACLMVIKRIWQLNSRGKAKLSAGDFAFIESFAVANC